MNIIYMNVHGTTSNTIERKSCSRSKGIARARKQYARRLTAPPKQRQEDEERGTPKKKRSLGRSARGPPPGPV